MGKQDDADNCFSLYVRACVLSECIVQECLILRFRRRPVEWDARCCYVLWEGLSLLEYDTAGEIDFAIANMSSLLQTRHTEELKRCRSYFTLHRTHISSLVSHNQYNSLHATRTHKNETILHPISKTLNIRSSYPPLFNALNISPQRHFAFSTPSSVII